MEAVRYFWNWIYTYLAHSSASMLLYSLWSREMFQLRSSPLTINLKHNRMLFHRVLPFWETKQSWKTNHACAKYFLKVMGLRMVDVLWPNHSCFPGTKFNTGTEARPSISTTCLLSIMRSAQGSDRARGFQEEDSVKAFSSRNSKIRKLTSVTDAAGEISVIKYKSNKLRNKRKIESQTEITPGNKKGFEDVAYSLTDGEWQD